MSNRIHFYLLFYRFIDCTTSKGRPNNLSTLWLDGNCSGLSFWPLHAHKWYGAVLGFLTLVLVWKSNKRNFIRRKSNHVVCFTVHSPWPIFSELATNFLHTDTLDRQPRERVRGSKFIGIDLITFFSFFLSPERNFYLLIFWRHVRAL